MSRAQRAEQLIDAAGRAASGAEAGEGITTACQDEEQRQDDRGATSSLDGTGGAEVRQRVLRVMRGLKRPPTTGILQARRRVVSQSANYCPLV